MGSKSVDRSYYSQAIVLFGDAAEIRMKRVARGFVAQEWSAVFGGEDQMNVNGGKGLWHDAGCQIGIRSPALTGFDGAAKRIASCAQQSQRDCVLQPKVGAPAPTLAHRETNHQPQRGCGKYRAWRTDGNGHNRVAVGNYLRTVTQGSSCLGILGLLILMQANRFQSRMPERFRARTKTYIAQDHRDRETKSFD
jgi:hypothetical protein